MPSRVLVTGATGFTGWHAASRLCAAGHRVRALARDPDKARKLLEPLGIDDADRVIGSMTDEAAVERALEGCDVAIHAAATVNVRKAAAADVFEDNVTGARLVVGGACERGLSSVVFVSSLTAIFDPRSQEPVTADSPLVASATRYGRSKAESDAFVRALQEQGAPISIVYPSAILGPDDPGRSESNQAFRGFLQTMIDSEGGTQFVDARDLASLLERIVERRFTGRLVAAGPYFDWPELRRCIAEVTGAKIGRLAAPGWVLRAAGGLADVVSRLSGRSLPLSREGLEVATRWRPIADSPEIGELGVVWRDPRETLTDLYAWMARAGAVPPAAVPKLAAADPPPRRGQPRP